MRKLFLLCTVITLTSLMSYAQEYSEDDKNKTTFGIKAGIDQTFVFNADSSFDQVNYYAGFFSDTRLSLKTSFQFELRYVTYRQDHFIEIPLLFKYHFTDKFRMYIGPRFDFILDDKALAKNFSLAAEFGVEYDISKHFYINASMSASLENQIVIDQFNTGSRQNFRLGLGYRF
ncbi:outer membrane beta-barrel protein [Winogradskyella poriferorum]|uniref:outer membrane beta-barrel protein n=1 Tax=Winogradskyella poriferorum TaxID=307627 RepID=UPI003D652E8A